MTTFTAGQRITAAALNTAFANSPQLIGSTTLTTSAASITVFLPAGYNHLHGVFTLRQDSGSGGAWALMRLNSDSGSTYTFQNVFGQVSTASAGNAGGLATGMRLAVIPGASDTGNYFATGSFTIGNASGSTFKTVCSTFEGAINSANGASGTAGGLWQSTAAVTSVSIIPNSTNFVAGSSMSIYGWG